MNYDDLLRELKMEAVSFPDISAEDLADIIHALENHFCNATKDAVPVRHGHWVCSPDDSIGLCSCCHYPSYGKLYYGHYLIVLYNYCPNCGARMEEVEE